MAAKFATGVVQIPKAGDANESSGRRHTLPRIPSAALRASYHSGTPLGVPNSHAVRDPVFQLQVACSR